MQTEYNFKSYYGEKIKLFSVKFSKVIKKNQELMFQNIYSDCQFSVRIAFSPT